MRPMCPSLCMLLYMMVVSSLHHVSGRPNVDGRNSMRDRGNRISGGSSIGGSPRGSNNYNYNNYGNSNPSSYDNYDQDDHDIGPSSSSGNNNRNTSPDRGTVGGLPGINPHRSTMGSHARKHPEQKPMPPLARRRPTGRPILLSPTRSALGHGNRPNVHGTNLRPNNGGDRPEGNAGGDDQLIQKPAFRGCERHDNTYKSEMTNLHHETQKMPMKDSSRMAVYPMTDNNDAMYLFITMNSTEFKAKIQGTNVDLFQCSPPSYDCEEVDTKSTKSKNLLAPHEWNYIFAELSESEVTIDIGPTKTIAMADLPPEELEDAEWFVSTGDGSETEVQGGTFLVQYPCSEYIAPTTTEAQINATDYPGTEYPPSEGPVTSRPWGFTPTPRASVTSVPPHQPGATDAVVGYTTESPMEGTDHISAIVVGVIVATLLLLVVVAMAVSIYRRRQGMQVTESTPLGPCQKPEQKMEEMAEDNQYQVQN